jgi:exopolysaccharide biosynthesis polyprenyl glycosylphosphotransferase
MPQNATLHQSTPVDFSISRIERRWLLVIFDLLALNGAFLLSVQLRPDLNFDWALIVSRPSWLLLLNAMWFFFGYLFQVYDLERAGRPQTAFISVLQAGFLTAGLYPFIPYLPPLLPQSRQPLFIAIFLPIIFLLLGRGLYLLVFAQPMFRRRALIVGAGWAGKTIFRAINEHGESLYELVGFVDDDPDKQDQMITVRHQDSGDLLQKPAQRAVLGGRKDIQALIREHRVHTVVLAVTHNVSGDLLQVLTDSLQQGIEVLPMPVLYEQLTGKVPVEHIGDHWSVSMPIEHPGTRTIWHISKRMFDIVWASLGLICLVLLFPFLALAIYIDSPGPIFYTQERVGCYGRPFRVIKFRSMVPDAEKDGAVWAREKDSRVTRVGRFLRKMHIDEFPQFLNILKGEMSVVGPRPERPEFIDELAEDIPFYRVRHAVKPGMAGWGLIHQGYGASKEDALVKLQYDLYYIKHQSFWLDLMILGRTFMDAFSFGGR